MGLFGGPTRMDTRVEPDVIEEKEEQMDMVPSLPKPYDDTIIAKGVTLSGALHGEGIVQVEGVVEGELNLSGSVIVAPGGLVKGPVTADVVQVAGCVQGNITARSHLRLQHTGGVEGDVLTASLVVEDGGILNGRSTMTRPTESASVLPGFQTSKGFEFGPDYDPDRE